MVAVTRIGKKSDAARAFAGVEDVDEDDSELFTVCGQLAAEEELLAPVHKALTLWESCFPVGGPQKKGTIFWERTVDWTVSVDYVEVLVLIYKLMEVSFVVQCSLLFAFTLPLISVCALYSAITIYACILNHCCWSSCFVEAAALGDFVLICHV